LRNTSKKGDGAEEVATIFTMKLREDIYMMEAIKEQ